MDRYKEKIAPDILDGYTITITGYYETEPLQKTQQIGYMLVNKLINSDYSNVRRITRTGNDSS